LIDRSTDHFDTISGCVKRKDEQRDGFTITIDWQVMLTRCKNSITKQLFCEMRFQQLNITRVRSSREQLQNILTFDTVSQSII